MADDLAGRAAETVDHAVDKAMRKASKTKSGSGIGMAVIGVIAAGVLANKKRQGKGARTPEGK